MKFLSLLILLGCSFNGIDQNQKQEGHEKLYSHPELSSWSKLQTNEERIILVATNDFLGNAFTQTENIKDSFSPAEQIQSVGGLQALKWYIDVLKKKSQANVIMVDSGQWLPGSQIISPDKSFGIFQIFKDLSFEATTLGASDFLAFPANQTDIQISTWLKPIIEKSPIHVIATNLTDIRKNQFPDWKNLVPSKIVERNGIKFGIIGLISPSSIQNTDPKIMNGFYIQPMVIALLKEARSLKNRGVDFVIVLTNNSIDCSSKKAHELNLHPLKVNFDFKESKLCSDTDELSKLLQKTTPGLVDIVVMGGSGQKVANIYQNTFLIESPGHGKYFSWIDLVINKKNKSINLEKSRIMQPIKLCHQFFKKTNDCFENDSSIDHREVIPATFMEEVFPKDLPLSSSLSPEEDRYSQYMNLKLKKFKSEKLNSNSYIIPKKDWRELKKENIQSIFDTKRVPVLNEFLVELSVSEKNISKFNNLIKADHKLTKESKNKYLIPFNVWKNDISSIAGFLGEDDFQYLPYSISNQFIDNAVLDQITTSQSQEIFNRR